MTASNENTQFSATTASAPRVPLSCFIIAQNEATRIAATIEAVLGIADEVVAVNSGSTDGTQAIAERLGARVIFNAWPGFGQQKRFAEAQCANNWLLNIDADEVISPALAREIEALFSNGEPPLSVYALKIKDIYPGQTKPRPWADDYRPPRLYDRRVVRFKDSTLHDSLDVRGRRVGLLKGAIHHFSVRSLDDHVSKGLERARYNAQHAKPKSRALLRLRVVTEFPVAFLRYYVGRRHFMGGLMGFQISMSAAFARFVRVMLMLERAEQAVQLQKDSD